MSSGQGLRSHVWHAWAAVVITAAVACGLTSASAREAKASTKHSSHRPRKRLQQVQAAALARPDAFSSRDQCIDLLKRGVRVQRSADTARIASWNVRWFPDGVPGNPTQSSHSTELEWMACALAWMNVDAVALAEIKSKPRSEPALAQLTQRLNELTNGNYTVHLDDCPDQNGQHVAWLLDERRVTPLGWQTHATINPNGEACAGQLRPGLGVTLRFLGGLDLHAIAVHLKSGIDPRDIALRQQSVDAMEHIVSEVVRRSGDSDVLIAGDFNSMGCRECPRLERSAAETGWLDTRLRAFQASMRRIPSDLGCSHYYQRHPALLDHVIVTTAMQEASSVQSVSVYGHCRELQCDSYSGAEPDAVRHLSDHCPIVVTLTDRDLD